MAGGARPPPRAPSPRAPSLRAPHCAAPLTARAPSLRAPSVPPPPRAPAARRPPHSVHPHRAAPHCVPLPACPSLRAEDVAPAVALRHRHRSVDLHHLPAARPELEDVGAAQPEVVLLVVDDR